MGLTDGGGEHALPPCKGSRFVGARNIRAVGVQGKAPLVSPSRKATQVRRYRPTHVPLFGKAISSQEWLDQNKEGGRGISSL